jgi:Uncharacterised nucleotidyltransferase
MSDLQAERELILLSAGVEARRRQTRARARRLLVAVDLGRLAEALRARRLLPSLGPRIVELEAGEGLDAFAATVDEAIAAGRRQSALLQLISQRATAALADAGIRSAALKGPQLAEAIYGDPGRRSSGDIDLLVPPERLLEAVEVVRGLGYDPPADHVEADGLPQLHFALNHERGQLPAIELHWRIHWYERDFAQRRLLPPEIDRSGTWRPAPADELGALLLFYARDGFVGLRLATDLGAWWDARGEELPPLALIEALRDYPALRRAATVAAQVAEATVGVPAAPLIGESARAGLRGGLARRLADPDPRTTEAQVHAEMGLIDGLLTPAAGLAAFVKRELLLPQEVLEAQDRRAPKRRLRASLGHSGRVLVRLGVLGRYLLALTRLMRRGGRRIQAPA